MHYLARIAKDGTEILCSELGGDPVLVGRSKRANVHLDDEEASSVHFVVLPTGAAYGVLDLNSSNGTWLNGERVQQAPLTINDVIRAGNTTFVLRERTEMGLSTAIRKVEEEHVQTGKGYSTMFDELVKKLK